MESWNKHVLYSSGQPVTLLHECYMVISKMNDKRTELLKQRNELKEMLDTGKSTYSFNNIKKMIVDFKKQAKEEHNDAQTRLKTAKSDMAD